MNAPPNANPIAVQITVPTVFVGKQYYNVDATGKGALQTSDPMLVYP